MQRQPLRAADPEFLRELHEQILKGIRPADPILKTFKGTPEQASAYFCRDVLYSDRPRYRPITV
jgi:hypothetical protein